MLTKTIHNISFSCFLATSINKLAQIARAANHATIFLAVLAATLGM